MHRNPIERRIQRLEQNAGKRRIEPNHFEVSASLTPVTSGTVFYMSAVGQGVNNNQRKGDRIIAKSVELRMTQIGLLTHNVRILLVRDKMNLGVLPAVTDILQSAVTQSVVNFDNTVVQPRFQILMDTVHSVSLNGKLAWNWNKKIQLDHPITYPGGGTTVASAGAGAHFLVLITDNSVVGNVQTDYQLIYTDA